MRVLQQLLFSRFATDFAFIGRNGTGHNALEERFTRLEQGFKQFIRVCKVDGGNRLVADNTVINNTKDAVRVFDAVNALTPNPINKDVGNLL